MKYVLIAVFFAVIAAVAGYYEWQVLDRRVLIFESKDQTEIIREQSNEMIDIQLDILLKEFPTAARARLAVIHGTEQTGLNVTPEKLPSALFDITNAKNANGEKPGKLVKDLPLTQWNDYLINFTSGHCARIEVDKMVEPKAKQRVAAMDGSSFIGCPIINARGYLKAGVFVTWTTPNLAPELTPETTELVQRAAKKIADALETRLYSSKQYK